MLSRIPLLCIPLLSFSAFATPTTFTAEPLDENQTLVRTEQQYLDMSMALRGWAAMVHSQQRIREAHNSHSPLKSGKTRSAPHNLFLGTHENKEIQTLPNGATDVKETPFPLEEKQSP